MKIYSIILYVVIFNLVCGFTGTAIANGLWGDELAESNVVILPYDERLSDAVNQFYESSSGIDLSGETTISTIINNVSGALTALGSMIGILLLLINSVIAFIPNILGLYLGLPDFFVGMITVLLYLVSGVGLFQLVTGRYFTMIE